MRRVNVERVASLLAGMACVRRAARAAMTAVNGKGPFEPDRLDRRDPELIRTFIPALGFLNARYFRLTVEGVENIACERALYVANHNGGIAGPDLAGTLGTLWDTLGPAFPLYAMAHDFAMRRFTPLGRLLQRLGALRAAPANAERVLSQGGQVLVYPGGELDAYRHFSRRNEVVFGARTGFIRVAQRTRVPIVPVVAHGAHSSALIFHEGEAIARRMGLKRWGRHERFPLALALPWGFVAGPWLPYLPLPRALRIRFLPQMTVLPSADPIRMREAIRSRMQSALDELEWRSRCQTMAIESASA